MCGIAGIYRRGAAPPSAAERELDFGQVERMLHAIEHRGPDDSGITGSGRCTLGVRRLSILDVEGGHQPIADASERVWAVQNGEIYNFPELRRDLAARHPMRTRTDTELLPYLWLERGPESVEVLRGMFATAIHDRRDETLLLARDPLGVKPLYVAEHGDRLLFASEIGALLTVEDLPRTLDPGAVALYLSLGFVPGEATAIAAIRKVRPGTRIVVTPAGTRSERYRAWPRFGEDSPSRTVEAATEEARRLLADSAQAMLLSDVPVGLLLSGGLDSSVLAAVIPEERRRELRTFCIGFENAGRHDERVHARRVAEFLGTRHVEAQVPLDVARDLPRVVRFLDEPCADAAAVPAHGIACAASREVKVLLSGTGGDEVFGGYRRYRLGSLLERVRALPRPLAGAAASWLANRDQNRGSDWSERLVWLRKLLEARLERDPLASYLSVLSPSGRGRLEGALRGVPAVGPAAAAAAIRPWLERELGGAPSGFLALAVATDFLGYLPDDLLLKEDRCTMGASVEGRVPYLDPALVAFGASLPPGHRFGPEGSKRLLRRLGHTLLPAEIASRPKHGFSVPVEDWLRGPLDAMVGDVAASADSGVFERAAIRRWHDEHRRGRDRSGALWLALVFETWWREVVLGSTRRTATARPGVRATGVP